MGKLSPAAAGTGQGLGEKEVGVVFPSFQLGFQGVCVAEPPRPGFPSLLDCALSALNAGLEIRRGDLLPALMVLQHPLGE